MDNPFAYISLYRSRQRGKKDQRHQAEQQGNPDELKKKDQLQERRVQVVAKFNRFVYPLLQHLRDAAYPDYHVFKLWPDSDPVEDEKGNYVEWRIRMESADVLRHGGQYTHITQVTVRLDFLENSEAVKSFSCWARGKPKRQYVMMTPESLTHALVDLHPPSEFS